MSESTENENKFLSILIPPFFKNEIIQQFYQIHQLCKEEIKGLEIYCKMIQSENTLEMYEGLVGLRTLLSNEAKIQSPLEELSLLVVCELNTLKYLINIIEHNELQIIIHEALWILVNLTSGSSQVIDLIIQNGSSQVIDQIIQNGSINCLIRRFSSGNYHDLIIEKICQIFGNVTAKSVKSRELMIKLGALKILNNYTIEKTKEFKNFHLIERLTWSIHLFFQFASMSLLKDLCVSLKIFSKWMQNDLSLKTLSQICWGISQFAQFHSNQISIIIDLGVIPRIMELIEVENSTIFSAHIKLLINILKSHQHHQEYLYGIGIIQYLGKLVMKYSQSPQHLEQILKAFTVISKSIYLSIQLLNSNELDQLLSLFKLGNDTIQRQIYEIMENLLNFYQYFDSLNQKQNKKVIMLCKILVFKNQIQKNQELCQRILNFCDKYLQEESLSKFHEVCKELKKQIMQKLK